MGDIQTAWDYDKSVAWMRPRIKKCLEVVEELRKARDELSNRGSKWNDEGKNWTAYLEAINIPRTTAHRWLSAPSGSEHVSTGQVEWYTPEDVIAGVRAVMGEIDCDPASADKAQKIVKAKIYYTIADNGLDKDWPGRVFLNPPFSMPLVEAFALRAIDAIKNKECEQIIVLVNNATDTDWFQSLCRSCSVAMFTDGRVRFYNNFGETLQARQGQAMFYWGPNVKDFVKVFSVAGIVFKRYE